MKPLFITVHGYKSGKPFRINANLIESLYEQFDSLYDGVYTNIFMAWFYLDKNNAREAAYSVKESQQEIENLIDKAATIEL